MCVSTDGYSRAEHAVTPGSALRIPPVSSTCEAHVSIMSATSSGCETVCDRPRTRRPQRPYATLIHGRERVRSVLEPHLGPTGALERANNIVQALVYED